MRCTQVQDSLEAFIEDDLSESERKAVEDHLRRCSTCRRQWEEAREIREALRTMPTKSCPPHVVREVMERTRRGPSRRRSLLDPLFRPVWRPVVGLALTVTLVLILRPLSDFRPSEQPIYSEREIQETLGDVKWTLAYVHQVMAHTQAIVQEKVIPNQVVQPIQNSIHTAIEFIKEGGGRS